MKMETLKSNILDEFKLKNSLNRIVDVVNFEGPLLTLYKDINNRYLYLLDWVDRDSAFNRWLIYRCNSITLDKFIQGKISHQELFLSDENYCYVVDIDKNYIWNNSQEINKRNLPPNYIPVEDAFFEEADCPNFSKLKRFLNEVKVSQKSNISVSINYFTETGITNFYEIADLPSLTEKYNDFILKDVKLFAPIYSLKNRNKIFVQNKFESPNSKSNYLKQYV